MRKRNSHHPRPTRTTIRVGNECGVYDAFVAHQKGHTAHPAGSAASWRVEPRLPACKAHALSSVPMQVPARSPKKILLPRRVVQNVPFRDIQYMLCALRLAHCSTRPGLRCLSPRVVPQRWVFHACSGRYLRCRCAGGPLCRTRGRLFAWPTNLNVAGHTDSAGSSALLMILWLASFRCRPRYQYPTR